jgi:hypothetical protein
MTHYLMTLYRRLRGQEALASAQLQLAACRALLATTMRDRDHYEAAVEVLALELPRRA